MLDGIFKSNCGVQGAGQGFSGREERGEGGRQVGEVDYLALPCNGGSFRDPDVQV